MQSPPGRRCRAASGIAGPVGVPYARRPPKPGPHDDPARGGRVRTGTDPNEEVRMSDGSSPPTRATPFPDDRPATLSRRQALVVGGGLAAGLAAGSVATGAAAAAAPGDSPDAAERGNGRAAPQTLLSVSTQQAKAVLHAAEREARRLGVSAFLVVVDVCGDLKAASRQDGNARASITLAPLKAATALAFRTSTASLAAGTTDPVRAQSLLAAGFTLLGGGLPITTGDGVVIGAIGVGGGNPEQDEQIAQAGLAALG